MQSIFTRKILVCAVLAAAGLGSAAGWLAIPICRPLQLVQPRKPVSTVLSIRVSA